jgi:antibiotic biosynthesis monooxygenase (ABM) superfamily enzyme
VRLAAPDLSPRLALLVIVTAQVCLLTYVIMPPLTRRLAFWLFPSPPQPKD